MTSGRRSGGGGGGDQEEGGVKPLNFHFSHKKFFKNFANSGRPSAWYTNLFLLRTAPPSFPMGLHPNNIRIRPWRKISRGKGDCVVRSIVRLSPPTVYSWLHVLNTPFTTHLKDESKTESNTISFFKICLKIIFSTIIVFLKENAISNFF